MKSFLYSIAIILTLSSCEDMLEKNPLDSLTPDQAFTDEQHLQLYINSFYQWCLQLRLFMENQVPYKDIICMVIS